MSVKTTSAVTKRHRFPLVPLSSAFISGGSGIKIPVSWRSVLAAYVRAFGLVLALGCAGALAYLLAFGFGFGALVGRVGGYEYVEFVGTDGSINEVDALILTPSGLYVLELKHWQGEIAGDGTQWVRRMPKGRLAPEDTPYILANRKAKRLAGLIRFYARQQGKERLAPYLGAAAFFHPRGTRGPRPD